MNTSWSDPQTAVHEPLGMHHEGLVRKAFPGGTTVLECIAARWVGLKVRGVSLVGSWPTWARADSGSPARARLAGGFDGVVVMHVGCIKRRGRRGPRPRPPRRGPASVPARGPRPRPPRPAPRPRPPRPRARDRASPSAAGLGRCRCGPRKRHVPDRDGADGDADGDRGDDGHEQDVVDRARGEPG